MIARPHVAGFPVRCMVDHPGALFSDGFSIFAGPDVTLADLEAFAVDLGWRLISSPLPLPPRPLEVPA